MIRYIAGNYVILGCDYKIKGEQNQFDSRVTFCLVLH